jgi:polyribonucleotide nucleotidyltransferase
VRHRGARPGIDFFPLSVEYVEKTFAAGKIPGGFFKREGAPRRGDPRVAPHRSSLPSALPGRLPQRHPDHRDRALGRQGAPTDVLALLGASAACHISTSPGRAPSAGVRVGRVDGKFVANPTFER